MDLEVKKAARTGFCFGVKRAIDILTSAAVEYGPIETLGAIVHNRQVTERLARLGIVVATDIGAIKSDVVAIGSHGVSPQVENEMRSRFRIVVDTTCPFVHRAQVTAGNLASAGFSVIVYGEAEHPEVKGILGYAQDKGIATMDTRFLSDLQSTARRVGVLSQTTQIPSGFVEFGREVVKSLLEKDVELRFIDTICHDIRERQQAALEVARKVDLMLIVGSYTSANTNHLADLCSTVTKAHIVESPEGIEPLWLENSHRIGVSSGASTANDTVDAVVSWLRLLI